jgi:hypothetical protein
MEDWAPRKTLVLASSAIDSPIHFPWSTVQAARPAQHITVWSPSLFPSKCEGLGDIPTAFSKARFSNFHQTSIYCSGSPKARQTNLVLLSRCTLGHSDHYLFFLFFFNVRNHSFSVCGFFSYVFVCFLVVLGAELRVLCLLNRHSTIWVTPPAFFVLVIFEIGSQFMPRLGWTMILLFVLPCVAGMTVHTSTSSHCVRWGLDNFLSRLALNLNPPNLHPPSS